jgi:hypothetical protein
MFEPFIFPYQATHVFFFDEIKKLGWKVVLWKEVRSRKKVADIENMFITTTMETCGLSVPITLSTPLNIVSLIGAIKLFGKDNLLASAIF